MASRAAAASRLRNLAALLRGRAAGNLRTQAAMHDWAQDSVAPTQLHVRFVARAFPHQAAPLAAAKEFQVAELLPGGDMLVTSGTLREMQRHLDRHRGHVRLTVAPGARGPRQWHAQVPGRLLLVPRLGRRVGPALYNLNTIQEYLEWTDFVPDSDGDSQDSQDSQDSEVFDGMYGGLALALPV